jgi:hypothetical protein
MNKSELDAMLKQLYKDLKENKLLDVCEYMPISSEDAATLGIDDGDTSYGFVIKVTE